MTILPESAAGAARLPFPVLYEDGELVAVDKPAGLLSVGNEKERQRTAYRLVSGYVKAADPAGKIFVVHRLDRDTSGVLLFAKDEGMKRALQDGWDGPGPPPCLPGGGGGGPAPGGGDDPPPSSTRTPGTGSGPGPGAGTAKRR